MKRTDVFKKRVFNALEHGIINNPKWTSVQDLNRRYCELALLHDTDPIDDKEHYQVVGIIMALDLDNRKPVNISMRLN